MLTGKKYMKTAFHKSIDSIKKNIRFRIAKFLAVNHLEVENLNNPFFIIATPGNLHVTRLCLKYIPSDQEVVIILNGLERWETKWAKENFYSRKLILFPIRVSHDQVIDYLLDWMDSSFGILDDDCFVFSPSLFSMIRSISSQISFCSCYGFESYKHSMVFPETFFLYLNAPLLKKIKKEFGVGGLTTTWDQLPDKVKEKISEFGFSKDKLPEDNKGYFDTLRVLMVLSLAQDYPFRFINDKYINYLKDESKNVFHVGAVTAVPFRGISTVSKSRTRGSYFWYRALEQCPDTKIKLKYYRQYGYSSSNQVLLKFPNAKERIGNYFFESVEEVISET